MLAGKLKPENRIPRSSFRVLGLTGFTVMAPTSEGGTKNSFQTSTCHGGHVGLVGKRGRALISDDKKAYKHKGLYYIRI